MKYRIYPLFYLVLFGLIFLIAGVVLAAERVLVVDVVIVPGQSAIIIWDGMLAELVEIDALTFMVDCIR